MPLFKWFAWMYLIASLEYLILDYIYDRIALVAWIEAAKKYQADVVMMTVGYTRIHRATRMLNKAAGQLKGAEKKNPLHAAALRTVAAVAQFPLPTPLHTEDE